MRRPRRRRPTTGRARSGQSAISPNRERALPRLGRGPAGAWRLPALGSGLLSRPEDEFRARGRGGRQAPALIVDEEPAVEALPDFDATAGIAAVGRELDPAEAEPHGIVSRDPPRVVAAEQIREGAGRAAPGGRGLGRRV